MGPSGSGKSTLLNIVGLLDRPDARPLPARRARRDDAVARRAGARLRSQRIGFVFQSFHLVPRLTAAENVALPMVLAGIAPRERAERVARALHDYGLHDRARPPARRAVGRPAPARRDRARDDHGSRR